MGLALWEPDSYNALRSPDWRRAASAAQSDAGTYAAFRGSGFRRLLVDTTDHVFRASNPKIYRCWRAS